MQKPDQSVNIAPSSSFGLKWLGATLAGALTVVTLFASAAVSHDEDLRLQRELQKRASDLAREIGREFDSRVTAIDRMSARWEAAKGTPQRLWYTDAVAYHDDFDGTQAVGWADSQGLVRWIAPREGNQSILGYILSSEASRAATLTRASSSGKPEISDPIDFVQGGKGIMIARALHFDGQKHGHLFMGFHFLNLLRKLNQALAVQGHTLTLTHAGIIAYQAPALSAGAEHIAEATIPMGDGAWRVQLRMSHEAAIAARSGTPTLILAAGLSVALLLSIVFWFMARSFRLRELAAETDVRWRFAIEGSNLGLWDWNAKTNHVFFSPRWKTMLGFAEEDIGDTLKEWQDRIHPDDKPTVMIELDRHFRGETTTYECDHRMLCKDGSYKWIQDRGRIMMRDSDGQPLRVLGTHTDITARHQLEELQQAQQGQLRQIFESQSVATFMIDHEHRVQHWNRASELLTGIPAAEIVGRAEAWRGFYATTRPTLADLVLDGQEDMARAWYPTQGKSPLLESGWHAENWFDNLGGKRRYMIFDAAPVMDAYGRVTAAVQTMQDITEQKHNEELILAGREVARQALVSLRHQKFALDQHAIVAITNVQGIITYANDKFCEISGYARQELLGQDHAILNSGHHPHGFFKQMYQTIARGDVWKNEVCNRAKDGGLYWVDTAVVPLMGDDGKPEQYISIRSDITARKQAEIAIRQSEEKFRSIFDHSNDAIMFVENGMFIDGNQRALEMFGLASVEELKVRTPIDLSPAIQPDGSRSADSAPLKIAVAFERGFNRFDWVHQRKNGETFPAEVALYTFALQGRTVLMAEIRDISDRKVIENELKQHRDHLQQLVQAQTADLRSAKESAERANKAKTDFLANMSHELRTPLHAILSFSELGKEKALSATPEKLGGYFERVHHSGSRLMILLNDLLDLSKLEAGKMILKFESHDVLGILLESLSEFDALIQANRIELALLPVECETLADVDALRISQLFLNVLSNAIKFTPAEGKITIRVSATKLRHGRRANDPLSDQAIEVEISDTGIGIPENELETIFDKFVQSSKTMDGSGGTGLGLSICKEIVEAHHGNICAHSNPEGGATFTITLPYVVTPFEKSQETIA